MPRLQTRCTTLIAAAALAVLACGREPAGGDGVVLTFPVSAVGDEGEVLRRQLRRFESAHPRVRVRAIETPDAADARHQLFVQWLGAGVPEPDVLQIDVVWTAELAAAGWILPLDRFGPDTDDYFPRVLAAGVHEGRLFALPWVVDVGMLYWRTDLFPHPPRTLDEMAEMALDARARGDVEVGLALQAARYEGLVTVFQEILGAFGGSILDERGRVAIDSDASVRALEWLRDAMQTRGLVPRDALGWREEQSRFAFQNGRAAFLRNWPYAYRLLSDARESGVAGRFAVAPMPGADGGAPTASLGGQLLAINAHTRHPDEAFALVAFLSEPAQMLERLAVAGQLPPRISLYDDPRFADASAIPAAEARAVIDRAVARPVTAHYSELSRALQVHVHRALTEQETPRAALAAAAAEIRALRARSVGARREAAGSSGAGVVAIVIAVALALAAIAFARRGSASRDEPLAWALVGPTLAVIVVVALVPVAATAWESLHAHDLREPWRGRPFVGLDNYAELAASERFWEALGHTLIFTGCTVTLELGLGLALALALDAAVRARGIARATALLPWALPTVVAALLFRFLFEGDHSIANSVLTGLHLRAEPLAFFAHATSAWVPLVVADVWKTAPFAALLLLAGLSTIDPALHEAARVDGAGAIRRFVHITLPLLRPTILVVLLFRTLDAFRVFDLVFVMTGGGPGTATEPLALYAFHALLDDMRFGYGSAVSVTIFLCTLGLALLYVRLLGAGGDER